MTTEILFVVEPAAEGGWLARAHGESIHVQAETVDELRTQVRDAVDCHFEPADKPQLIRLHFVHDEVLAA
jgi:predicted RNase H-like HicB family nuclease